MSITISKRLSNSFEGALAGGGDPATSPLYVFGPFLKLIIVAGVAKITFGVSVWLAVFSVVVVSAMYRQVMYWITDGSGGSGLSEEEFGSWAVKMTAGITIIEYVLTYLVSMAALVTFIADRFTALNGTIYGLSYRSILAIFLSVFCCWVVNLGPKVSARAFGPATGAVLLLLWCMVFASIYTTGFHLPDFNLQAFSIAKTPIFANFKDSQQGSTYLHFTLGGYARILALMTGIEIFANLVSAYDGTRAERSKKAFGSLLIIMGTTIITMLIVGPVIFNHSNPANEHVSVFTQTMDYLFSPWFSYIGTLIGVAVLLSACAAAAQAIQNLALGLRYRHYVPAKLGQRNKHDVADMPVWMMGALCSVCFLLFGTKEDTYLALYAAGVFILLSMTGWAAFKRLIRELRCPFSTIKIVILLITVFSALLTTFATVVIFNERFFDGAWFYFLFIPIFYLVFSHYRKFLGSPPSVEDRLGKILSIQGIPLKNSYDEKLGDMNFKKILIPLNDTDLSVQQLLPLLLFISILHKTEIDLLMINNNLNLSKWEQLSYLRSLSQVFVKTGLQTHFKVTQGNTQIEIDRRVVTKQVDMMVLITVGNTSSTKYISNNDVIQVVKNTKIPSLIMQKKDVENLFTKFKRILVALDGSEASEFVLSYLRFFAKEEDSNVFLLSVPEGNESDNYSATMQMYLDSIANKLQHEGLHTTIQMLGSGPARTILAMAEEEKIDLIMMTSHGQGGIQRAAVQVGSVTEKVIQKAMCSLFIVPVQADRYLV